MTLDKKTRLLLEDDFVEVFVRQGSSDYTLVTFSCVGVYANGASYWGQSVAEKLDLHCIGIMSKGDTWFPEVSIGRCLPDIQSHLKGRVLVYGSSMGAYAAIKYSRRLSADTVIAFSPQATISEHDLPGNSYSVYYRHDWHVGMLIMGHDLGGSIYLFCDTFFSDDQAHVALMPASDRIRVVPVNSLRHNANFIVVGSRIITDLFKCCLDRNEAGIGSIIRTAKRKSPTTYEGASMHLLERGKYQWAAQAQAEAQLMDPSDARMVRFTRAMSVAFEKKGKLAEAAAILRDALEVLPRSETLVIRLAEILTAAREYDDAVAAFGHSVKLGGRRAAVYHGFVHAMVMAGRRRDVLPIIRHGVEMCPGEASLVGLLSLFGDAEAPLE